MTPDAVFAVANTAALLTWVVLVLAPRNERVLQLAGTAVPLMFAAAYAVLAALFIGRGPGNFNSLTGVEALFTNRWMLLAGWVHYLAFDLFVGVWEARDAARRNIPRWLLLPCLVLTFLLGPAGWLFYRFVRAARTAPVL